MTKIAISGTHGVGKTTLLHALQKTGYFNDYFADVNVTRWVAELGFDINERTSDVSQEINLIKRIAHLNSFNFIIADRAIHDVIAYSKASHRRGHLSSESFRYQCNLFDRNFYKYDIIFRLYPEFPIENDGVRATDEKFQDEIAYIIESLFKSTAHQHNTQIVNLTGTVEDRVEQVLDTLIKRNV